jgi:toxin HigB-1
MIQGFQDRRTESIFRRERVKGISVIVQQAALLKLLIIEAAESLEDLRVPPGDRLEKLVGNRKGQYSIRVNDQWRICFSWSMGDAYQVELADYH